MKPKTSSDQLLKAKQVAEMLQVSRGWVFNHASGRRLPILPSFKVGGAVRFRLRDIVEFLKRSKRCMERGIPIQ